MQFNRQRLVRLARLPLAIGGAACFMSADVSSAAYRWSELQKQLQDLYTKHDRGIREALPRYSSMPPVLDLTGRTLQDGLCDTGQHLKIGRPVQHYRRRSA